MGGHEVSTSKPVSSVPRVTQRTLMKAHREGGRVARISGGKAHEKPATSVSGVRQTGERHGDDEVSISPRSDRSEDRGVPFTRRVIPVPRSGTSRESFSATVGTVISDPGGRSRSVGGISRAVNEHPKTS